MNKYIDYPSFRFVNLFYIKYEKTVYAIGSIIYIPKYLFTSYYIDIFWKTLKYYCVSYHMNVNY